MSLLSLSAPFPKSPRITLFTISSKSVTALTVSFTVSVTFSIGLEIPFTSLIILLAPKSRLKKLNFSNILSIFSFEIAAFTFVASLLIVVVTSSANGTIFLFTSFTFSRIVLRTCTSGPFCTISGATNSAPILANADFTLENAPFNVSFAFLACSPNALSIAEANVEKEICPLDTMSLTSCSVFPNCSAKVAAAFIPLPDNCNN